MGSNHSLQIPKTSFSLLIIASVLISIFIHHSLALSINHIKLDSTHNVPAFPKRAVPDYADIQELVVNQAEKLSANPENDGGLTTVFYTQLDTGINGAECWGKTNKGEGNYLTFNNAVAAANTRTLLMGAGDDKSQVQTIQKLVSRALAENAEGEIILLIDDGKQPAATSTWMLYEFPAIQHDNELFTEVVRIDPKTGSKETIWTQGQEVDLPKPLDS